MKMMLGIFRKTERLRVKYSASVYPFTDNGLIDDNTYWGNGLMQIVEIALSRCTKCYFVLDDIHLPLREDASITCRELSFILNHPYLLEKVVFIKYNKELTEVEALTYLRRQDLITQT